MSEIPIASLCKEAIELSEKKTFAPYEEKIVIESELQLVIGAIRRRIDDYTN